MKIEHIGLMVKDLEGMRAFYEHYFKAKSGDKYHNPKTTFQSYFLTFDDGARLEIGTKSDFKNLQETVNPLGYAHLAISVGTKEEVDRMAEQFLADGFTIKSGPRTTGDGYYEAVVLDPEQNEIEITK
ncbi:VOC family protein [Lactococcus fujiensis]|uniref:Lactoylglutathione lyase related lyase n=1 Tax=Lactococcus fujiensis JCM 16395 TaxID=1291764 RepID=A0A2A5RLJ2_9LACT|nr:VOC family protein [Lactococcus fujiensis]PCS00147.1 lactoylglutathione lyase related lyase [Lactococcus fujiensis JCM 16395]